MIREKGAVDASWGPKWSKGGARNRGYPAISTLNWHFPNHLTLNSTEEHISQTCTAFYDVLVEVEKA